MICRLESLSAHTGFMKKEDMNREAPKKIGFERNEKYLVSSWCLTLINSSGKIALRKETRKGDRDAPHN